MMIWRDQGGRTVSVEVANLWIDQHRNTSVREWQDFRKNSGRHYAFVVIRNNQHLRIFNRTLCGGNYSSFDLTVDLTAMLAICAHNHLVLRDDSGLDRGRTLIVANQSLVSLRAAVLP